jgi:hypothetical protein
VAPDVFNVLPSVTAMLVAVVFGGHLELFPTHIEECHGPVAVEHRYLRGRGGQTRIN